MRQRNYFTITLAVLMFAHGSWASADPIPAVGRQLRSLFPVKQDGRFGYIDRFGGVVIPPRYEYAGRFAEGRALVLIRSKPHFIDDDGKVLFPSPFEEYNVTFAEGYAGGRVGRDGYRYVDRQGTFIEGSFAAGGPFSEGLAAVGVRRMGAGQQKDPQVNFGGIWFGFVDTTGTIRIPPQFLAVGAFSHGLAPVYVGGVDRECTGIDSGKWGYIDPTGRMVIAAQFDRAGSFSEGLAAVGVGDLKGYIDTKGRYVIPLRPHFLAGPFREGLAYVRDVAPGGGVIGNYYYINKRADVVLPPDPRFFAFSFSGGSVPSYFGNGSQGLIDKQGRWLLPPEFDHVEPVDSGLAYVAIDGKIGYVDAQGRFVWQPTK
jgi:hypothetical protein